MPLQATNVHRAEEEIRPDLARDRRAEPQGAVRLYDQGDGRGRHRAEGAGGEVAAAWPGDASEAWAGERDGELWLFNCYIPEYQGGVLSRFEPKAPRKLLLKHKQIDQLLGAVARDGVTLVPCIHFNDRGLAKVLLGVGRGPEQSRQAARHRGARLAAGQGAADAGEGVGGGCPVAGRGASGCRQVSRMIRLQSLMSGRAMASITIRTSRRR